MTQRRLCFVLMPFGVKSDASGKLIDFERIYNELIAPAIRVAGLEPLRADEGITGAVISKAMYERLMLCEYVVADLTTADPSVLYQLGVRHGVRSANTILLSAEGDRLPFDVSMMRSLSYHLDDAGMPSDLNFQERLVTALSEASAVQADSPVFLMADLPHPNIAHLNTDIFRERVRYSSAIKDELTEARRGRDRADAIRAVERQLGSLDHVEAGVLVDLLQSYRAAREWKEVIRLAGVMPEPLRRSTLVREQLAFALNRTGESEKAEQVLLDLILTRGPSSETYGLLGRVYKDRWEAATEQGDQTLARDLLDKAIEAYLKAFETDWRDAYPGFNAATLMTLRAPPDPRLGEFLPVVRYAVERKIESGKSDYWDHATMLELAVLANDENGAMDALDKAVAVMREHWQPQTTARNLQLIREAREARGEALSWAIGIEEKLKRRAA